ncbi:MAG: HDIG domain-containing protein [Syntrophotaleaceae bacterium]
MTTSKPERKSEAPRRRWHRFCSVFPLFKPFHKEQNQRYLLLFGVALIITAIIVPKGGFVPGYYSPGDIASRDIKASRDLLLPDQPLTEKKRDEAARAILSLYDFDSRAGEETAGRLFQIFNQLGTTLQTETPLQNVFPKDENSPVSELTEDELILLARLSSRDQVAKDLQKLLVASFKNLIVGNLQVFESSWDRGIIVRDLVNHGERAVMDAKQVTGIGDVFDQVEREIGKMDDLSPNQRIVLLKLLRKMIRPNLTFNQNETEERRRKAGELVKPVLFQMKKGEMIVREGERVTEEQIRKLRAMRAVSGNYSTLLTGLGLLLCILLLIYLGHRFARSNISKYRPKTCDLLVMALVFVSLFILIKVAIFISTALESAFPYIESSSYYYAIPFAAGAMLIRIVLNSEVSLIFSLAFSALVGILFGNNLFIAVYALVGSLTGANWVRQCLERATLYRAGIRLSMVNFLLVLSIHLMAGRGVDSQFFYKAGFGLAGGFFCALLVTGLIPLIEWLFKYTTDIKLLELANMNTPVLRELMIQAPGTYHHSIIVGNLAEAAAETIGANPLLARVAAYYHDIGKIRKPLYFVENIGCQENRHDKLTPSMSALILMAHVKDGADMARENKLGQLLVDIIRQHHGTALIKYFFDKAKQSSDPGVHQVNERDYRYPGPKPQNREAALIMLADAVEAASRTLTDPTPARIQGMVQKIINNIFIDGQLDECELTLKDLHNIAKSFNRILSGIFHHRIDYPEPVHKEREKEPGKRKNGEDSHRESADESKDKDGTSGKSSTEDLKRLGMS